MTARSPWMELIDTLQFGLPGIGAAYLLRGRRCVLIDTGTEPAVHRWINRLREVDLCAVVLTHVHVDHAGGLGAILSEHPEAKVYVSSRGAAHLIDPTLLNRSVSCTTGNLAALYGSVSPVSEGRLRVVETDTKLVLAEGVTLEAIETPGHAPHHLCFLDETHGALFCGDAVGLQRFGKTLPATSPPSFDLGHSLNSLRKLVQRNPLSLWLTHFGRADEGVDLLSEYSRLLGEWIVRIRGQIRQLDDDALIIRAVIEQEGAQDWPEPLREELAMFVRGGIEYVRRSEAEELR